MTSLDVLLLVLVGGCSILAVINYCIFLRRKAQRGLTRVEMDQVFAALADDIKIAREVLPMDSERLIQMMKREKEKNGLLHVAYQKRIDERKREHRHTVQK